MNVLELALDNVFMSKFSPISCDFKGKFRKEKEERERKVKDVNIFKRGGGVIPFLPTYLPCTNCQIFQG